MIAYLLGRMISRSIKSKETGSADTSHGTIVRLTAYSFWKSLPMMIVMKYDFYKNRKSIIHDTGGQIST